MTNARALLGVSVLGVVADRALLFDIERNRAQTVARMTGHASEALTVTQLSAIKSIQIDEQ